MSFARGLSAGVNSALSVYNTIQRSEQQDRQNARQDKAWAREDAQQEAIDKANESARQAFEAHRTQFEQANDPKKEERISLAGAANPDGPSLAPAEGLRLGSPAKLEGAELGAPGTPGLQGGLSLSQQAPPVQREQVTTAPAARYDEREGVLAGLSARRKALMSSKVDDKLWLDDWAKESQLRGQIRSERVDNAEKRFMATGDPGEYAKAVYPLIEDGYEFVAAQPVKGVDGQQAWQFIRRDVGTGKEAVTVMNAQQFQRFMMGVRDPKMVADYEAKSLLERMKADEKIRADREEESAKQGTERVKSGLQLGEIAAKGKEDRRTVSTRGAEDRATDKAKPLTLGEGQIAVAPGRDGKYETKAEGKPRTLGSTSRPSAPNQVLDLRREASEAIASGKDAEKVRTRFRELTGEEL